MREAGADGDRLDGVLILGNFVGWYFFERYTVRRMNEMETKGNDRTEMGQPNGRNQMETRFTI